MPSEAHREEGGGLGRIPMAESAVVAFWNWFPAAAKAVLNMQTLSNLKVTPSHLVPWYDVLLGLSRQLIRSRVSVTTIKNVPYAYACA